MFERLLKKAAVTVNETIISPIKEETTANINSNIKLAVSIGSFLLGGAIIISSIATKRTPRLSGKAFDGVGSLISEATITINNYYLKNL